MINEISYSIDNAISELIYGIPNVFKALLLLLLAWVIAIVARSIIQKVFVKMGVSRALTKTPIVQDEAEGEKFLENIGKFVYLLVFILFLPPVFNALNMTEVAAPISNMMDQFIGFIPNLIAATIIIVIGVYVAKIVKELFKRFFDALNIDKLLQKLKPKQESYEETQTTLSSIIANIIYIIILIPFITVGLEALNIDTISKPIQSVLNDVIAIIPNVFVAIILVTVGYYIGKFLNNLLTSLLQGTGINNIYKIFGVQNEAKKPSFDLAKLLGNLVQILILLFFTVEALHVINLQVLNTIGHAVIQYLPFLFSALLILGAGFLFANILGNWIKTNTNCSVSATLFKVIVITFAIFMTLDQLHFATSIVNTAFLLILGGLMIAFAISFGIGGRDFAKGQLEKLQHKLDKDK